MGIDFIAATIIYGMIAYYFFKRFIKKIKKSIQITKFKKERIFPLSFFKKNYFNFSSFGV